MSESKIKLNYFNVKGVAEGIRYLFAYAEVDFEDNRIAQDQWPVLKESFEYRQLPVLEVDGKTLNQSVAIYRYLGKRFGLVASDPLTEALLESIVDNIRDIQPKVYASMRQTTPDAKKELNEAVEFFLKKVEVLAAGGFLYGDKKPTWVDFYFTGIFEGLNGIIPDVLKDYPNLTSLTDKIRNSPSVKKYIENRPEDNWVHAANHGKTQE